MNEISVPVLIVGGGVVGLSASLFLAQQGIGSMLVERHPTTSIHPRSRGVNGRTMELFRSLGLAEEISRAGARLGPSIGIYRGKNLVEVLERNGEGGWLVKKIRARGMRGQSTGKKSPTGPCRCTQDDLEPILLAEARRRGVEARFSTECASLESDCEGVVASVVDRHTQLETRVRARYAIAADGSKSPIRERLGIARSGSGPLSSQLNLLFRADLGNLVKGREFSMCLVEDGDLRGLVASIDNQSTWVLHVTYRPERGERPSDFPKERCIDLIRRAIGIPDLDVELRGALPWESAVRVAERFRCDHVFLAGDAAHVMPPWGGFGANTGIQDAHNLAWKLAAVIERRAAPALLDTYDAERRPVARAVGEISGAMNDERGLIAAKNGLATMWSMRRVFPYLTMGYGYASSAVVLERGSVPGPGTTDLRGRPGTRAPHVWLERDGETVSTLDLFGRGFVLLSGPTGDAWMRGAKLASERTATPVWAYRVGVELGGRERAWRRAYGVARDGAVLVRPDGIVAWRAKRAVASPSEALVHVLGRILGN